MATDFDVVVLGSGFGGAITSCRLAEAATKFSSWSAAAGGSRRIFRAGGARQRIIRAIKATHGYGIKRHRKSEMVGSIFASFPT